MVGGPSRVNSFCSSVGTLGDSPVLFCLCVCVGVKIDLSEQVTQLLESMIGLGSMEGGTQFPTTIRGPHICSPCCFEETRPGPTESG